jgi:hypothetical protein
MDHIEPGAFAWKLARRSREPRVTSESWGPDGATTRKDPFAAIPDTMAGKTNMPQEPSSPAARKSNGSPNGGGHVRQFGTFSEASNFLWSIADLLRGDYKQYDYGKVILPFTVLRRLDCVLADTKARVLAKHDQIKGELTSASSTLSHKAVGKQPATPRHATPRYTPLGLGGSPTIPTPPQEWKAGVANGL